MNTEVHLRVDVPERPVLLGGHEVAFEYRDEALYISPKEALQPFPQKLTDRLIQHAQTQPDKVFAAKRNAGGEWVRLSYAEVLNRAWRIAQSLHDRPLGADRPLLILSGNDLEHLCLSLGAMLAGVPFSVISPAYSLVSKDFINLQHVVSLATPGMVFASDGQAFAAGIRQCVAADVEVVTLDGRLADAGCTAYAELLQAAPTSVQAHYQSLDEHCIAKILFTSGSTKLPKAVPTTHLMLCANQQMLLQTFPEFATTPPVLLDWLSWHHTFGGSHNLGVALYNGGTIYIDEGKPVAGKFDETIRNLKEISPTIYFNVPKGWEALTEALEQDEALRDRFFAQVKILFFAGASLSSTIWDRLDRLAEAHCGERIRIMCGLGMTETAPSCSFSTGPRVMAGFIGFPVPGCDLKVVPIGDKLEFRVKGPQVMKGYWRQDPDAQQEVFDEEGYFRTGDAVRLVDPDDPTQGLMYDGRLSEDFKLDTGTFVNAGSIRTRALVEGQPYVEDVCVTGANSHAVGLLVFPSLPACAHLAGMTVGVDGAEAILAAEPVRAWFKQFLVELNRAASGSANTVAMLALMATPPRFDLAEVTDKGNLNPNNIIKHRADLVNTLYQRQTDHPLMLYYR
ncbi:MAG: feruloyl-CoA synthase [Neisseriaceae bacterium]|nr:feruloyl-CoA synthase [Neisseriaceae bacterium]MBP6862235.1 feruloyl-CoA synthase [Neisseriaceae bacterium]